MNQVTRRDFTGMLSAALALNATFAAEADAQAIGPTSAEPTQPLQELRSGVFHPQPSHGSQAGHLSHPYLIGRLKAGNIRLEMHESVQQPGAEHEPIKTHKHSEIWLIQRGVGSLYINGSEHRMEEGDLGLVCAGDEHWIKNIGETELAYFVLTVGPPE